MSNDFVEMFKTYNKAIIDCYIYLYDSLEDFQDVPDLMMVYDTFYGECLDKISDAYEETFGDSTSMHEDLLEDIGCSKEEVPNILFVCKTLNCLHLPYVYLGVYYGLVYNELLPRIKTVIFEER